ncbi:MAG: peptidase [bacterium]|jgi:putative proteasome-type protease
MTYCLGLFLEEGLVLLSDTRTNAGIDNVSTYRKMHLFHEPGERLIALMSSGNLAVTQAVVNLLTEGIEAVGLPAEQITETPETLMTVPSMFRAAQLVGEAVREVYRVDGQTLEAQGAGFSASFLLGGQVRGRPMRLFQVYSAGNFIEASSDTPYLQIGEHKYGKPILDRAVHHQTSLLDGVKLALISMDSTLRSNLSVGLPADLVIYRRNQHTIEWQHRIEEDDPYFRNLRQIWSDALQKAYQDVPDPDWLPEDSPLA